MLRQFFCRHDWEKVRNVLTRKNRHYIVMVGQYRCRKCGKVVYR